MATTGNSYRIAGSASPGSVPSGSCAFCTYVSSASTPISVTLYVGPGGTIPGSFSVGSGTVSFVSGIIFSNS